MSPNATKHLPDFYCSLLFYACNVERLCLSQPLSANYNTALHTELISAAGSRDLMTLRQQEITACSK